jgi:hypothetical protein
MVEAAGVEPVCPLENTEVANFGISEKGQKGGFAGSIVQSLYKA